MATPKPAAGAAWPLFYVHDANIGLRNRTKCARMSDRKQRNPIFPLMKVELIEKAAAIVGDNQLLVNIVSKRVQQINHGADPYVPTTPDMGSGDIALTEIVEGKLVWHEMTEEEYQQTLEEGDLAPRRTAPAPTPKMEPDILTVQANI